DRVDVVGLGDRQVGPRLDGGQLGGAVVGRVGIGRGARHAGRVGQAGGPAGVDLDDEAQDDGGVALGDGAEVPGDGVGDRAVGAARGRDEGRAGRDRVTDHDTEGVGRAGAVDGDRVGQVVAGGDRVDVVGLGDRQVGPRLDGGQLGGAVV